MRNSWKEGVWLRRRTRLYARLVAFGLAAVVGILGANVIRGLSDADHAGSAGAADKALTITPDVRKAKRKAIARKRKARFTMTAVGDVIMGTPERGLPPDNGAALFDAVERQLTGKVVIGNLEGPLTPLTTAPMAFRTPSTRCALTACPTPVQRTSSRGCRSTA